MNLTIKLIADTVCEHQLLRVSELISGTHRDMVLARHVTMYLATLHTKKRPAEIARFLGGRTDATVHYARRRVAKLLVEKPSVRETVAEIVQSLAVVEKSIGLADVMPKPAPDAFLLAEEYITAPRARARLTDRDAEFICATLLATDMDNNDPVKADRLEKARLLVVAWEELQNAKYSIGEKVAQRGFDVAANALQTSFKTEEKEIEHVA